MSPQEKDAVAYAEVQRWSQPILWIFIVLLGCLACAIFLYQVVFDQPVGNSPAPDALVTALLFIFGLAVPLLFLTARMRVEIRVGAVHVRHFPFASRRIPLKDIIACQARTYRPLREYGGWGVRWGFSNGWAFTISGNRGVQLTLADGARILIGSHNPEKLAAAINTARQELDGPE